MNKTATAAILAATLTTATFFVPARRASAGGSTVWIGEVNTPLPIHSGKDSYRQVKIHGFDADGNVCGDVWNQWNDDKGVTQYSVDGFITEGRSGNATLFAGMTMQAIALGHGVGWKVLPGQHIQAVTWNALDGDRDTAAGGFYLYGMSGDATKAVGYMPGVGQVIYTAGKPTVIEGLDTSGQATAVNSAGDTAGYEYSTVGKTSHAFLLKAGSKKPIDVGNLIGTASIGSEGIALNGGGQLIGNYYPGKNTKAFVYSNGVVTTLPTLGGYNYASGINETTGAGTSYSPTKGYRAVVWSHITGRGPAIITDLNLLLPPGSGWILTSAEAINAYSDVVGEGYFNGKPTPFFLRGIAPLLPR